MDKSILISIIIPVYNIAPYLSRCLDSVINQTYKNIEIIIVNDGSTDESGNIADIYEKNDKRVKVIHKENQGVSIARNIGIDIAKGDYIGFVDGDDYIEPDMYELLLDNAIKYNADISHCGYKKVFTNKIEMYYGTEEIVIQYKDDGVCDLLLNKKVEPGIWNKLYIRRLFNNIRFKEGIKNYEDLLANYYLFLDSNKSVFIDKAKYNYIVRKDSAATSKLSKSKLMGIIFVVLEIERHSKNNKTLYPYALYKCITTHINSYNSILAEGNKNYINEKKQIRSTLSELFYKSKSICLLSLKQRLIVLLIIKLTLIYEIVYFFYNKSKKLYELNT